MAEQTDISITMLPHWDTEEGDPEMGRVVIYANKYAVQRLRDLLIAAKTNSNLTQEARADAATWADALE